MAHTAQNAAELIEKISDSETSLDEQQPDMIETIEEMLVKPTNIVSSISGMDKCVRMAAYSYKLFKAFSMIDDPDMIKKLDVISSKLSFIRTIFLRNRKWMIINQMIKRFKTQKSSKRKDLELVLKLYLLGLDSIRLVIFVMRLGLVKNDNLDNLLKKWSANGYFLECVCWTAFYAYDYFKAGKNLEKKRETKLYVIKYICDSICSYNDSTIKTHVFSNKTTSALGVLSTAISLYLAWK